MTEPTESAAPAAEPTAGDTNVLAIGEDALDKALGDVLGTGDDDEPAPRRQPKAAADEDDELEAPEEEEDEPADDDDREYGEDLNDSGEESEEPEEDEEAALDRAHEILKGIAPYSVLKRTPKAALIAWANRVEAERAAASSSSESAEEASDEAPDTKAKAGKSPAKSGDAATRWAELRSNGATSLGVDEESFEGAVKPLFDMMESLREENAAMRADQARVRDETLIRDAQVTIDGQLKRLEKLGHQGLRGDAGKVEKLIEHATALIRGKVVKTAEEAFTAAAKALLPRPRRTDLAQHRRNGFSEAPLRRSDRASSATSEDEWWAENMDHAYAGRRNLIGRSPIPTRNSRSR